jgi:hypothetical protein
LRSGGLKESSEQSIPLVWSRAWIAKSAKKCAKKCRKGRKETLHNPDTILVTGPNEDIAVEQSSSLACIGPQPGIANHRPVYQKFGVDRASYPVYFFAVKKREG